MSYFQMKAEVDEDSDASSVALVLPVCASLVRTNTYMMYLLHIHINAPIHVSLKHIYTYPSHTRTSYTYTGGFF